MELPPIPVLSPDLAAAAKQSMAAALQIATLAGGPAGASLRRSAETAFMDGFGLAMLTGAALLAAGYPAVVHPEDRDADLEQLQRLLAGEATVDIGIEPHQVTFAGGGRRLTSRLVEGEFPKFRSLIPSGYESVVTIERQTLLDALKQVTPYGQNNNPVRLTLERERLQLARSRGEMPDRAREGVDVVRLDRLEPAGPERAPVAVLEQQRRRRVADRDFLKAAGADQILQRIGMERPDVGDVADVALEEGDPAGRVDGLEHDRRAAPQHALRRNMKDTGQHEPDIGIGQDIRHREARREQHRPGHGDQDGAARWPPLSRPQPRRP